MDFLHYNDMDQYLLIEANAGGLLGNARVICEFFGIKYDKDIGDKLKAFYRH